MIVYESLALSDKSVSRHQPCQRTPLLATHLLSLMCLALLLRLCVHNNMIRICCRECLKDGPHLSLVSSSSAFARLSVLRITAVLFRAISTSAMDVQSAME
jgi:hypothetical protein